MISGVELELVTEKQIPYNGQNRPLLAAHSPKDYLDKLSSIPNISKMLVIPWGRDEINDWISYTNAVELGSKPAQQSPSVNKVMLAALKDANILMNPANGMVHFRNRDILAETVQILLSGDERFTPEEIKIAMVSLGWNPTDAQEGATLIRQIQAGKRHKFTSGLHWNKGMIESWRKQAEEL